MTNQPYRDPDKPGRMDIDGNEWWACDPYPTWYRCDENGEIHRNHAEWVENATTEYYEVAIRNMPFLQAQALYRILVDLYDEEKFHGSQGMCWSGLIAGKRKNQPDRTVTLTPMVNIIRDAKRLRDA